MNRARPQVMLEVQNTFGNALYCDIKNKIVLSDYDLADVAAEMKAMIQEKTPITLSFKKKQEAWSYVKPRFYCDQAPLLSALPDDVEIPVYELDGVSAYFVNPLLPHLGYLKEFELIRMGSGILLRYGKRGHYDRLEPFARRDKLAAVYADSEKMGQRLHCPTVAALNQFIKRGNSREIILACEAQHEKRLPRLRMPLPVRSGGFG